jgi:hypothetical protein
MSASVAKRQSKLLFDCPAGTQTLILDSFLSPTQLLAALKNLLDQRVRFPGTGD